MSMRIVKSNQLPRKVKAQEMGDGQIARYLNTIIVRCKTELTGHLNGFLVLEGNEGVNSYQDSFNAEVELLSKDEIITVEFSNS